MILFKISNFVNWWMDEIIYENEYYVYENEYYVFDQKVTTETKHKELTL